MFDVAHAAAAFVRTRALRAMLRSRAAIDRHQARGCARLASAARRTIPFYRDTRIIAVILQVVFALVMTGAYFGLTTFTTGVYKAWLVMNDRTLKRPIGTVLSGLPPGGTHAQSLSGIR